MSEDHPPPSKEGVEPARLTLKKDPYAKLTRKLDIKGFPDQPLSHQSGLPCTVQNIEYLIEEFAITVRFNIITKKVEILIPGHSGSIENAASTALVEVQSIATRHGVPIGQVPAILELLADRNPFNPVRVWIESRPWDGEDRLAALCATLVTDPDFPVGFRDTLIVKWMLSAVAAAFMPSGFRARGVLTLQGPQGLGKTSWVASLVSDPTLRALVVKLDHHLDGGSKDSILIAIAHWLVEIGELESSFKKDVARLKGFLTNTIDKVRRPYGKAEMEYQRRSVFLATVNSYDFLIDSTGNTRFWTLPLVDVNFDHGIDMQQVWAQLAVQFHKGAQWWLTPEEEEQLAYRNSRHRAFSPIRELLQDVVDFDAQPNAETMAVTATELLERLGIDKPSNQQAKECGALLRENFGDAPVFGIPFGARHISVHVELPDTFPVRHEPYRRFVQLSGGDQRQVEIEDFADAVFRNRPAWLIEIINSLAPKSSASTEDLRKELQDLLNELRIKTKSPREAPEGQHLVDDGGARGAHPEHKDGTGGNSDRTPVSPTDLVFSPGGAKRADISKNLEQAPDIITLRDPADLEDKGITGKAARYVRETNQLFINLTYSAVEAAQEDLGLRYAAYEDPELVAELARQWSERLVMGRVGYAVVYAQAKQLIRAWTSDDVKKALEPESLSLAADGWRDAVSTAYRSISSRLGAAKSTGPDEDALVAVYAD